MRHFIVCFLIASIFPPGWGGLTALIGGWLWERFIPSTDWKEDLNNNWWGALIGTLVSIILWWVILT